MLSQIALGTFGRTTTAEKNEHGNNVGHEFFLSKFYAFFHAIVDIAREVTMGSRLLPRAFNLDEANIYRGILLQAHASTRAILFLAEVDAIHACF